MERQSRPVERPVTTPMVQAQATFRWFRLNTGNSQTKRISGFDVHIHIRKQQYRIAQK